MKIAKTSLLHITAYLVYYFVVLCFPRPGCRCRHLSRSPSKPNLHPAYSPASRTEIFTFETSVQLRNYGMSTASSSSVSADSNYTSFLLWDIDREFQNAHDAYEQWMAQNRKRRSTWQCIASPNRETGLERALSLGSHVKKTFEQGKGAFGSRFERGDCEYWLSSTAVLHCRRDDLTGHSNMPRHSLSPAPADTA